MEPNQGKAADSAKNASRPVIYKKDLKRLVALSTGMSKVMELILVTIMLFVAIEYNGLEWGCIHPKELPDCLAKAKIAGKLPSDNVEYLKGCQQVRGDCARLENIGDDMIASSWNVNMSDHEDYFFCECLNEAVNDNQSRGNVFCFHTKKQSLVLIAGFLIAFWTGSIEIHRQWLLFTVLMYVYLIAVPLSFILNPCYDEEESQNNAVLIIFSAIGCGVVLVYTVAMIKNPAAQGLCDQILNCDCSREGPVADDGEDEKILSQPQALEMKASDDDSVSNMEKVVIYLDPEGEGSSDSELSH